MQRRFPLKADTNPASRQIFYEPCVLVEFVAKEAGGVVGRGSGDGVALFGHAFRHLDGGNQCAIAR